MSNGTGVELKISTDKAKQQINELISNLKKLHEMFDRTMELKVQADTTAIKTAEQDVTNLETTIGNVDKTELKLKVDSKELEKVADGLKEVEEESKKTKQGLTGFEKITKSIAKYGPDFANATSRGFNALGSFSANLTRWAGRTAQAVVGIFDRAVSGVSNLASEGFEQLQTLENSMAGYRAFFSEQEGGFDQTAFKKRIIETANRLPGLDTGGLADAIMQLAPISSNSDQAYNASLGVIKAIKYSGGDSSELGYVIRNLRDVMAKGKMNERDRQQFMRAIPALEKILISTGQTQFLDENGKLQALNENPEIVAQFVEAFAKINESPEINKVFEEMQNTTQGVLEKFQQTMQSSFLEAFETPGANGKSLVDTLKQFLNDNNIQKFADVIAKVGQKIADFVSTINFDEVLDKLFSDAKELGEHIKKTLIPTIKELLGLDENSSTTEMIKRMMDTVKKFLKGMIDGFNNFLNIVNGFKSFFNKVFPNADFASILGNIAGFSKFGFKGISAIGNGIGSLSKIVGGLTTKGGGTLLGGELSGGSGLIAKVVNKLGSMTGRSGIGAGAGLIGGAGIAAIGSLATNGLADLTNQVIQGNEDLVGGVKAVGNVISDVATGFSVAGPWGALIGGGIGILEDFVNMWKEDKKKQEEIKEDKAATIKNFVEDQAIDLLQSQGLYIAGEDYSIDARNWMHEYIGQNYGYDNLQTEDQIKDAVNAAMQEYMNRFNKTNFANQLSETLDQWSKDPNKQESTYLTTTDEAGRTVLAPENEAQYGDKINQIFDVLSKYGVINPADQNIQTVQEKFQFLKTNGIDLSTAEELNDIFGWVVEKNNTLAELWEKMNEVKIGPNLDQEKMDKFQKAMDVMTHNLGWVLGKDGKYYAEVNYVVKRATEKVDEERKNDPFGQQERNENPLALNNTNRLEDIEKETAIEQEIGRMKQFGEVSELMTEEAIRKKAIENLKAKGPNFWKLTWGNYAFGGPIRLKHFAGGGKPWGVDTVPTMLQPGEFVIRKSAAEKIGYPTLTAMNQGDLMAAYRNIGADISARLNQINTSNNTYDHSYHRKVSTRQVINNYNYNRSGATNSIYRSFRNIAALAR